LSQITNILKKMASFQREWRHFKQIPFPKMQVTFFFHAKNVHIFFIFSHFLLENER